jgi:ferritin-like protein
MSSETLHEDPDKLGPLTLDQHRAIVSLMEELEAVDWYNQRVQATSDAELRAILAHNRDEEKEHASMVLEWLRRNDPTLDQHLRTFLFSDGPIGEKEAAATAGTAPVSGGGDGSLGIGSLRGRS